MDSEHRFIVETPRLGMRPLMWDDRLALSCILRDPEVMYAWKHGFSEAEVDEWMRRRMEEYQAYGNFGYWALILKGTGALIGQCGVTLQEVWGRPVPEVAYLLGKEYWHRGYATEAAQAVKSYAFETLGFPAVYSLIRDTNLPSIRVAERNGMKKAGEIMKHYQGKGMLHIVFKIKNSE